MEMLAVFSRSTCILGRSHFPYTIQYKTRNKFVKYKYKYIEGIESAPRRLYEKIHGRVKRICRLNSYKYLCELVHDFGLIEGEMERRG